MGFFFFFFFFFAILFFQGSFVSRFPLFFLLLLVAFLCCFVFLFSCFAYCCSIWRGGVRIQCGMQMQGYLLTFFFSLCCGEYELYFSFLFSKPPPSLFFFFPQLNSFTPVWACGACRFLPLLCPITTANPMPYCSSYKLVGFFFRFLLSMLASRYFLWATRNILHPTVMFEYYSTPANNHTNPNQTYVEWMSTSSSSIPCSWLVAVSTELLGLSIAMLTYIECKWM